MSSFDPLGLRPDDPLEKWRTDAEQRERDVAHAREEQKRREQRACDARAANETWSAFEQRLAAVEQSHNELRADAADITRATADAINTLRLSEGLVD
jgi:hypothetical protein